MLREAILLDIFISQLSPQGFRCILKTRATSFLNDIKQHIIVEVVEILKTQDVNWNVQSSKGKEPSQKKYEV